MVVEKKALIVLIILFVYKSSSLFAQQTDSLANKFLVDLEIRPRIELNYNFNQQPSDTLAPYFFITQRNRLSASYNIKNDWKFTAELQEIHEWDKYNSSSRVANINFYQLFFEYRVKNLKFRIGRQGVLIDNGRIFSNAPWAQQSRAHEGVRITEQSKNHSQDLYLLFTRNYGDVFDPSFSPVAAHKYKYLFVHHFNHLPIGHFAFNTTNSFELLESQNSLSTRLRVTTGGRIELKKENFYATLNGYYQFGRNQQDKNINAYYLQSEISFNILKSTIRVGTEIMSGDRWDLSSNQSNSFDIKYGVAWRFMGNMNIFSSFPKDLDNRGLINPYLSASVPINDKITLRSDFHLFYSQYLLKNEIDNASDNYLGFENDLSIKYRINQQMELNYGFSYFSSSSAMAFLPKIDNVDKIAIWNYLMFSYRINIIRSKR